MSFLNPTGLWLLLGIPVLIIIYLIKAQHEDRPVSSTYIWKLSQKFMKKKLPLQRMKKFLIFLMQLLMIVAVAFMAARPAFQNGESYNYIVIIDASASMQIEDESGKSRFEYAIDTAEELSSEIDKGHTFSMILSGDSANYLVQESTSKNEVKLALNNAECSFGECNTEEALSLAELLCSRSKNAEVVFLTDNEYTETKNIEVINFSKGEWNVSVERISVSASGKDTVFTSNIISYNKDASVTVGLKIDGSVIDAQIIECVSDEKTEVYFTAEDVSSYDTAEIFVEVSDALSEDNSYVVCRKSDKTYGVTLVSDSPLYLESALSVLGNCEVSVASSIDEAELSGKDLYIFDGITPEEYPTDGSVVLFSTDNLPDGVTAESQSNEESALTMNTGLQDDIYNNLSFNETVVSKYSRLTGTNAWTTLLYCGDSSVMLTSETNDGMQFSIISFDLHNSNLPLQTYFVVFVKNLVEFSVPGLLRTTDYNAGDTVKLTVMPTAEGIYVELPDESIKTISTSGDYGTVVAEDIGVYTAVMQTQDGGEYVDFFVHIPKGEVAASTFGTLEIELSTDDTLEAQDAISEIWIWLAAIMLILVLAEWGWYYHEQY